ncbi:hypothetical protein [Massilia rubra]|uniref:Uncharacterized protein n=1 Tax=Massilia rubra TaxID=2607910 RepID=A0ABX0LXB7_9BURK|nr:hypothetical protein [Massilia rubra]NHZ36034.1 hypothetical protein [Massilia rubra]
MNIRFPFDILAVIEQAGKTRLERRSDGAACAARPPMPKTIHGRYVNAVDQDERAARFVVS